MADIDFANADSRMNYLKDNLGHLMNGIDKNYGQVLMDELMRRMESTVSEFNEEVKEMLGQLQGIKTTPRDNILAGATLPKSQPVDLPQVEPIKSPFDAKLEAQMEKPFAESNPEPPAAAPEVEIEVDLGEDELSDFEKKLRSLGT